MHIAFIANRLNIEKGGSDLSLDIMASNLVRRGHDVKVITVNTDSENRTPADTLYEVIDRPLATDSRVSLARDVYGALTEYETWADVYHVFNPPFISVAGYYRSRGGDSPVVGRLNNYTVFCTNTSLMDGSCHKNCTLRNKVNHDPRSPAQKAKRVPMYFSRQYVEPRLINRVDRLFAISPAVKRIYSSNGLSEDLIAVVPNFYHPAFARDVDDRGADERTRLLYVGRITENKGVGTLIDAFETFDPKSVDLRVIGDGSQRKALERTVSARGLENVSFAGWVPYEELPERYARADVFVHPAKWPEPFGRTLLEAMQYRCGLVVSDAGAPGWVAGTAGLTFTNANPDDLSAKLGEVVRNPRRLATLQRNASDQIERFAPDRVLDMIEDQYRQVLRRNDSPGS